MKPAPFNFRAESKYMAVAWTTLIKTSAELSVPKGSVLTLKINRDFPYGKHAFILMDGRTDSRLDRQMDGRMDRWTDGQADRQAKE